jgi:hypothetical protein
LADYITGFFRFRDLRHNRDTAHGRSLRSMPMRSIIRLAISSIEHSVASITGTPYRWNKASALRTS